VTSFESMDKRGKRTLNVMPGHFERRADALARVTVARHQLIAAKQAFLQGVIIDATD
jgi:hypothetical protein